MQDKIIKQASEDFDKIFNNFQIEISKINIGRANSSMVENILIESYGSKMPIIKIAQISTPDPKSIAIQPCDSNLLKDIEKAIEESNLNLVPSSDGKKIIISLPDMTQERRVELSKVIKTRSEETKIALRNSRQKIWESIQEQEKKGEITEDDKFRYENELNKLIEENNKKINELTEQKIKEISNI